MTRARGSFIPPRAEEARREPDACLEHFPQEDVTHPRLSPGAKAEEFRMTSHSIGLAAGAIWKKLHEKGTAGLSFGDLKKIPGFSADEIVAGAGWLARESKI